MQGVLMSMPLSAQEASATQQQAQASTISHNLSAGYYYSRGDYDQVADTTIHYFPLSYDVTVSGWNLQASVAHLEVSGMGNVLMNVGGLDQPGGSPGEIGTWSGLGDTILSATYQLPSYNENGPFLDLGFEVKLATADEDKGLGTGATDYGLQLDVYQLMGATTWFATVGYRFRGSSSVFAAMEDSAFLSLGFSQPLTPTWSYGLIYDFREAASATSLETHELLPFASWSPTPSWNLMGYAVKGFTDDSADLGVGLQLGYRW